MKQGHILESRYDGDDSVHRSMMSALLFATVIASGMNVETYEKHYIKSAEGSTFPLAGASQREDGYLLRALLPFGLFGDAPDFTGANQIDRVRVQADRPGDPSKLYTDVFISGIFGECLIGVGRAILDIERTVETKPPDKFCQTCAAITTTPGACDHSASGRVHPEAGGDILRFSIIEKSDKVMFVIGAIGSSLALDLKVGGYRIKSTTYNGQACLEVYYSLNQVARVVSDLLSLETPATSGDLITALSKARASRNKITDFVISIDEDNQ